MVGWLHWPALPDRALSRHVSKCQAHVAYQEMLQQHCQRGATTPWQREPGQACWGALGRARPPRRCCCPSWAAWAAAAPQTWAPQAWVGPPLAAAGAAAAGHLQGQGPPLLQAPEPAPPVAQKGDMSVLHLSALQPLPILASQGIVPCRWHMMGPSKQATRSVSSVLADTLGAVNCWSQLGCGASLSLGSFGPAAACFCGGVVHTQHMSALAHQPSKGPPQMCRCTPRAEGMPVTGSWRRMDGYLVLAGRLLQTLHHRG